MPFQFVYYCSWGQAVSRNVYSALDRSHRTEYREKISKPNRKGRRIEPCRKLCVRLTDLDTRAALRFLQHKMRGVKPPATSLTSSYFQSTFLAPHKINTTSDVTTQFWPSQNGHQFSAFERLKKQVSQTVREKKVDSACKQG